MLQWLLRCSLLINICLFNSIHAKTDYSIVFVHIGTSLPAYVETSITQARQFNKSCDIYLIANDGALKNASKQLKKQKPIFVTCESLTMTSEHIAYRNSVNLPSGFWLHTSERFLYLYDLIHNLQLTNVFHLENDNMLYVNLKSLLPIFQANYSGLGVTFDSDQRCIAGFVYIAHPLSMQKLANFFAMNTASGKSDMETIMAFKKSDPTAIDHLPIIPETYSLKYPLKSSSGLTVTDSLKFSNHVDLFDSIFDAAAIGQYLGGGDVYFFPDVKPGFINESCIFNPSYFKYFWKKDKQGRKVPYIIFNKKNYRINNLHIHSKQLEQFKS